jgi:hypothetical protein
MAPPALAKFPENVLLMIVVESPRFATGCRYNLYSVKMCSLRSLRFRNWLLRCPNPAQPSQ